MKTMKAKIALYEMGKNFDRVLPALSLETNFEDAEAHIQFLGWANIEVQGNELVIEIPDLPNDEDEMEMSPPPRYA
jgi:hypothetical protein